MYSESEAIAGIFVCLVFIVICIISILLIIQFQSKSTDSIVKILPFRAGLLSAIQTSALNFGNGPTRIFPFMELEKIFGKDYTGYINRFNDNQVITLLADYYKKSITAYELSIGLDALKRDNASTTFTS